MVKCLHILDVVERMAVEEELPQEQTTTLNHIYNTHWEMGVHNLREGKIALVLYAHLHASSIWVLGLDLFVLAMAH